MCRCCIAVGALCRGRGVQGTSASQGLLCTTVRSEAPPAQRGLWTVHPSSQALLYPVAKLLVATPRMAAPRRRGGAPRWVALTVILSFAALSAAEGGGGHAVARLAREASAALRRGQPSHAVSALEDALHACGARYKDGTCAGSSQPGPPSPCTPDDVRDLGQLLRVARQRASSDHGAAAADKSSSHSPNSSPGGASDERAVRDAVQSVASFYGSRSSQSGRPPGDAGGVEDMWVQYLRSATNWTRAVRSSLPFADREYPCPLPRPYRASAHPLPPHCQRADAPPSCHPSCTRARCTACSATAWPCRTTSPASLLAASAPQPPRRSHWTTKAP